MKTTNIILLTIGVLSVGALICMAATAPKIRWLGRITYAEELGSVKYDPFYHVTDEKGNRVTETGPSWNFTLDKSVEIGLREDGVVVWREVK